MALPELNPEQAEAVEYMGGPLLVLAGAGSGKTRVLTCRIAHILAAGLSDPWRILAMTFTNKAAGEMTERVCSLVPGDARRVKMGTFHSICAWILRREAAAGGWPENFSIYDSDDQKALLRRLLKQEGDDSRLTPGSIQSWISRCKNSMLTPAAALEQAGSDIDRRLAGLYASYDEALRRNGAFDFDDLLTCTNDFLCRDLDAARRYGSMFDHVLVDEYQDTNLVQRELLRAIAGPGCLVCAVGDDDQSIYGWRGARVQNILEFPSDFPGTRIVRLERNYRSTAGILAAASSLVSHNRGRHGKVLWTDRQGGGDILLRDLASPEDEAGWIIGEVSSILAGGEGAGSLAVLYRTNAQSRLFESAALRAGIPYQVVGSLRFYEREEIKDIVAWLRVLVNPADLVSFGRVVNKPARGIGDRSRDALIEAAVSDPAGLPGVLGRPDRIAGISRRACESLRLLGSFFERTRALVARGAPVSEVVDAVVAGTGMLDALDSSTVEGASRLDNISEFRRSAIEYDMSPHGGGTAGFVTQISLLTTSDEYDPSAGRLSLMTLHCAKGLEFGTVFVAGVEEGLLPFVRPGRFGPDDVEEERRLLYVGMTRAMNRLYLTMASRRARPGVQSGGPSRFLAELLPDGSARAAAKTPEPEASPAVVYRRGNIVHHPRYGMGMVLKAARRGGEWQLEVDFGFDEPKSLLTGYVPITIVRERGSPADLD